ncbi:MULTISPECIES: hypothetical protein [unclassified Lentimonas]|uniref:hypothetical protein n=1 Tax=unclassified Lentimonas TaxID=2630993 RepID=UPI001320FC60|nr:MULTISPECIES: hypothetical protein [unclassified Lentimonas]CAA6691616.1 Unannotated [Lentimonas sp. CC19]CAA6692239.1 Unannotated [Lentimonas sp. CC10]CAA7070181.1 Unannotated [Lentimonas sp. CC11]
MPHETEHPLPHNEHALGKPLNTRKKRGTVFMVIAITVIVHVLGLGGLAAIKIIEVLSPEPEFEAPPVVEMAKPPPPPPPPPTTKRSQKSLPRPQPLAAQNPQNMSVPAIVMEESDVAFGRGFGGGLGELGGGIMDRVDVSFFGIEGGNNIVILLDRTGSGSNVFSRTRAELLKTIDSMKDSMFARLAVIYFGGKDAGMRGIPAKGQKQKDPTKFDFWWPKGIKRDTWLSPGGSGVATLVKELQRINPKAKGAIIESQRQLGKKGGAFILGTQYWGALNSAYKLEPAPDTIYFMVEPNVAFPSTDIVKQSYALFKKFGVSRPENTKVIFIIGNDRNDVKSMQPLNMMVNLINGGDLSPNELRKLIVFTK